MILRGGRRVKATPDRRERHGTEWRRTIHGICWLVAVSGRTSCERMVIVMPTVRRLVLAVVVMLVTVVAADAQNFGSPLSFTFDVSVASTDGGAVVSGYVHNNNVWRITRVRVGVDVLDASGQTVGTGSAWVVGDIAEGGRGYFIVRLPSRGAGYRPSVVSFEYLEKGRG